MLDFGLSLWSVFYQGEINGYLGLIAKEALFNQALYTAVQGNNILLDSYLIYMIVRLTLECALATSLLRWHIRSCHMSTVLDLNSS